MKVLLAFLANTAANFLIGLLVAKFLGPEEYGRFALAFSIAVVVQTALYDWLRLSATRFYSQRTRENAPIIRATLGSSFVAVTALLVIGTFAYSVFGPELDFDSELILLALLTATANGLFDYSTALARARFEDGAYGRLVLVKNAFSLVLIGSGAFLFRSAGVALAGGVASLLGTVILSRARPARSRRALYGRQGGDGERPHRLQRADRRRASALSGHAAGLAVDRRERL